MNKTPSRLLIIFCLLICGCDLSNIRVRDIPQDNTNDEWLKEYRDNLKD